MLRWFIELVGKNPFIFNTARRMFEANFSGEKKVIQEELGNTYGKILDVPCGTGEFSFLFKKIDYVGVDLDKTYVDYATKKHHKTFMVMDATKLNFQDHSFDSVLVIGFFHHLSEEQIDSVLGEVKRVLKKDGKFLLIEDAPVKNKLNFIGRLGQKYDRGATIREAKFYIDKLNKFFEVKRDYPMRSGFWQYHVFVGVNKNF